MNGPNKLECYITLGWKGLPGKRSLAFWTISISCKEFSSCSTVVEHSPQQPEVEGSNGRRIIIYNFLKKSTKSHSYNFKTFLLKF